MMDQSSAYSHSGSWSIEEIPYHALARDRVRKDTQLFYLLASASFIEITSDIYTHNLVEFFGGDSEVVEWLTRHWEKEEVQHGMALRRYVQTAWPEFEWDAAYRSFFAEYTRFCSLDYLAPTRALEMVARCVVETGTATFYRMLSELAPEPVLRQIASKISTDEVRHYKHFYRYFRRYQEREQPGRAAVLRKLLHRAVDVDALDAFCAFKHVYLASNPGAEFRRSDYLAFRDRLRQLAKDYYPHDMAIKMLLKPLGLSPMIAHAVLPMTTSAMRLVFYGFLK